ncbi:lactocepin [Anaerocolumna jejuensis DSM 15929]|uniref:Lactocepin n=1 Tax=Anaerocolumna jejuensis DSM 15929 TaxID=1121322 RepID=A0A1M6QW66_9FIRM|nr:S8 family serine peptidase [Anaerocolumna jejuensis]SHK24509.1 lactocepin [Anaerocolumna jejuensis DSM 15929]
MRKKVTAVATALVLAVTSTLVNPFAYPAAAKADIASGISINGGSLTADSTDRGSKKPCTIPGGLKGYDSGTGSTSARNKLVTVIVELEGAPLLEQFIDSNTLMRSNTYSSFDEFSKSAQADMITSELKKQQDRIISQISNKKTFGTSPVLNAAPEVLYHYTNVMNGFAIRINYGAIASIRKIKGVKTAYEAPVYNKIDPVMDSSTNTIGASTLWDLDYKGQSTAVAIIDTGLDVTHPGFQTMPASPKYSNASSLQARLTTSSLESGITDASKTFVNTKVPYAYDYADKDENVIPSPESVLKNKNEHGTHVAGTVAAPEGDSDNITGVAPEAQLMIMKVFSDTIGNTGASTENILAAIEDAVVLGADVINMSLGSSSGFTDEGDASISDVYARVENAGITMAVSAGNSYSSTYGNGLKDLTPNGLALSSNPDTSVVGSPSTYITPLSVASVVNTSYHAFYFETEGTKITYGESAEGDQPLFSSLSAVSGGAIGYVTVPGTGKNEDYAGIDVAGKIALVSRGGLSFNDKLIYARNHGAIAIIISNNTTGSLNMAITDYDIPAVAITQEDGNFLRSAAKKIIKISGDTGVFPDSHGNTPSDFSSWGITPDLKLKPEIAAPGENIYSTLPGGKYGSMSGTSMASPHIAGAYALMKQYLNEKTEHFLTSPEKAVIATDLLMSTAVPSRTSQNVPFSPRKQGSGIVNVYNAVNAGAYLYTEKEDGANGRPKLNLGDDASKAGVYTKSFHIRSITGSAISYVPKAAVLSEAMEEANGLKVIDETAADISDYADVSFTVNGTSVVSGSAIKLDSEADLTVDVTITLKDEIKQHLDAAFENGAFIDGYLTLVSDGVDLSIPFMGFYGDWTKAPLFDSGSAADLKGYQQDIHALYSQTPEGYAYLGVNPFDSNAYSLIGKYTPYLYEALYQMYAPCADTDKIAISPNGDGYFDSLDTTALSLLRNARTLHYQLTDEKGNTLMSDQLNYLTKTQYISSEKAIVPTYLTLLYKGLDAKGAPLPNNSVVTLTVNGELDYSAHEQNNAGSQLVFPITIDTEKPALTAARSTEDSLLLSVKDNQYVAAAILYNKANEENPLGVFLVDEDTKGKESDIRLDKKALSLTGVPLSDLTVTLYDYAMNSRSYDLGAHVVTPTPSITDTPAPSVTVSPTPGGTGTPTPSVTASPSPSVTSSPTPSVSASPSPSGTAAPTPVVTTPPGPTATAAPTPTATAAPTATVTPTPTVTPAPDYSKAARVTISHNKLYPKETAAISVKLPGKVTDKDTVRISYSSSDTAVASVTSLGNVNAIAPGTAAIKVKVTVNNNSSTYGIKLTVKKPYISFTKKTSVLKAGKSFTFKAKAYGIQEAVTYSLSDTSIAVIDEKSGKLKAQKPGIVYITAKADNYSRRYKLTIR